MCPISAIGPVNGQRVLLSRCVRVYLFTYSSSLLSGCGRANQDEAPANPHKHEGRQSDRLTETRAPPWLLQQQTGDSSRQWKECANEHGAREASVPSTGRESAKCNSLPGARAIYNSNGIIACLLLLAVMAPQSSVCSCLSPVNDIMIMIPAACTNTANGVASNI